MSYYDPEYFHEYWWGEPSIEELLLSLQLKQGLAKQSITHMAQKKSTSTGKSPKAVSVTYISASEEYRIMYDKDDVTIICVQSQYKSLQLGDFVTNGTKMRGHITKFQWSKHDGVEGLFVYTDWSGIGMNVEAVYQVDKDTYQRTPAQHQYGDSVIVFRILNSSEDKPGEIFAEGIKGEITGTHFYPGKVKYDIELRWHNKMPDSARPVTTRIYNVDSVFVEKDIK